MTPLRLRLADVMAGERQSCRHHPVLAWHIGMFGRGGTGRRGRVHYYDKRDGQFHQASVEKFWRKRYYSLPDPSGGWSDAVERRSHVRSRRSPRAPLPSRSGYRRCGQSLLHPGAAGTQLPARPCSAFFPRKRTVASSPETTSPANWLLARGRSCLLSMPGKPIRPCGRTGSAGRPPRGTCGRRQNQISGGFGIGSSRLSGTFQDTAICVCTRSRSRGRLRTPIGWNPDQTPDVLRLRHEPQPGAPHRLRRHPGPMGGRRRRRRSAPPHPPR
jgi:hypothetical protein